MVYQESIFSEPTPPRAAPSSPFNWGDALGYMSIASGVGSLLTGFAQASAMEEQAAYQRQMYEANKRVAEIQADDAIYRGEKDAQKVLTQAKRIKGAQRAALAAQGLDVGSGSAAEIQADTEVLSQLDANSVRNNAWREAWGYKIQATNYGAQARFATMAGNNAASNSLVTGGLNFLNSAAMGGYYLKK